MSRRAFIRWLLLIGASLIGVSAFFANWLKRLMLPDQEAAAQADPATPSPAPPTPQPSAEPPAKDPIFSYFILSDLHISVDDPQTSKKLKLALDDIQELDAGAETIMITGDVTDTGTERDYKELGKVLSQYQLPPMHANMGNHDYYTIWINKKNYWDQAAKPNGKTDAQSREQFMKFFGYTKPYNEFTVKGHSILLLSQEAYVQEMPEVGEGAWYSDEQLNWLKERLKALYQPGKPIFIMTHQPLPAVGSNGGNHQLIRAVEFREIVKPYKNVFVFCGHRHQDFQNGNPHYIRESFHYFHNSSVGRPLNRSYQQEAKGKSQGMYVQVYADRVVLKGREFTKKAFLDEANWTIELQKA